MSRARSFEASRHCRLGYDARQRGQALTEFLVVALALVPLFLIIPLIAKYQDMSHATQMASRYVAFDGFVRNVDLGSAKSESQLADEVRRRFFSNADAPIKTNDVAGNFLAHRNLFWRGAADDFLIEDLGNQVQVTFGNANAATPASGFSAASDGAPFLLHKQLDLPARGIYTANVSVAVANIPAGLKFYEPFDQLNLAMTRSTSVTIGPWAARNPQQVEAKIGASPLVFPVGPLALISPAVDGYIRSIDSPNARPGPLLGKLDFWRDVVPQDRLKAAH